MLTGASIFFLNRTNYTQTATGRWRAEFRGPFVLTQEADTLEQCRRAALNDLDARVEKWLASAGPTGDGS